LLPGLQLLLLLWWGVEAGHGKRHQLPGCLLLRLRLAVPAKLPAMLLEHLVTADAWEGLGVGAQQQQQTHLQGLLNVQGVLQVPALLLLLLM
jgi:hypothetical protein